MLSYVFSITATPPGCHAATNRIPPTRSMSLRERRQIDSSPIPRSQSGNTSPMPPASSSASTWSQTSSIIGGGPSSSTSTHPHVNLLHASEQHYYSTPVCQQQPLHYQAGQVPYQCAPHDSSYSSQQLDLSLNSSWVSID